jgi:hypothetical protein
MQQGNFSGVNIRYAMLRPLKVVPWIGGTVTIENSGPLPRVPFSSRHPNQVRKTKALVSTENYYVVTHMTTSIFVNRIATRMDTEEQQLGEDIRGGRCKGLFRDLSLVKHSPPSMEPQGSLLWTQEPANASIPQIDEFSQHLHTLSL